MKNEIILGAFWDMLKRWILIGIAILALILVIYWVVSLWQADLADAEVKERQAAQALVDKQKAEEQAKLEREAHEAERKEWAEQQAALTRSVLARNQATERRIAAALAPKPVEQVSKEAKETLGIAPLVQDGKFTLTVSEMQEFVALKLDRDRLAENLKETEKQLVIERQTTATLRLDLEKAVKSLEQSNKVIEDYQTAMKAYKQVAKKSRLRRTLEFSGKAGLTVALAYLGAKAAR